MSIFLDILRCILCCEEDDPRPYRQDHDVTRLIRNRFQNPTTTDYTQVPHYDPLPSIIANSTRNYSYFIPQSNAHPITRTQYPVSSVASNFPHTSTTPSVAKPKTENRNCSHFIPQSSAHTITRPRSPISSVASNFTHTSTTPSVAKPKTEDPRRPPQVSYANSTTHSVVKPKTETPKRQPQVPVVKPKAETPKRQPQVPDANSTIDEKPLQKSSPKPLLSSTKPAPSLSRPDLSSVSSSSSIGIPQLSIKPTLSQAPFNPTVPQTKTNYVWVAKDATPLYMIPEDIKGLIEKDIVPGVLKKPLSLSTYTDYFAALLYAEDYYLEKWDGFEMKDVSLQLHKAAIYGWKNKNKHLNRSDKKDDKIFVAFEIDSVPERRPFLLSRDFASVRPSGTKVEPFQGIIYRVVRSNLVLVEFGEDFYFQHYSACKYDVKFSFNRVCLKRAHQAIAAASDVLFRKFIFPEHIPNINPITTEPFVNHKLDREQVSAVCQILSLQDPPPYLVEGPLSVINSKGGPRDSKQLSRTGVVIREAVLQICLTIPSSRVLICAPLNSTCDMLMRSLQMGIPESDMFRANAAFREIDGVPIDILPSCLYKGECFACPSLKELKKYKVILSTFMSTFRLRGEGIVAGHFSHIFLVDASCATEPETMVPLANLAKERTAVVITGAPWSCSGWVRSKIARENGLMISYFERLRESKVYKSLDSKYITQLKDEGWKSDDRYNSPSFV